MTTDPTTETACRRCAHDERTRGVLQLSALELYPPDHDPECRAALRDRIAEALLDHLSRTADIRPGRDGALAFMPEVTDDERLRMAAALAAVLPDPAPARACSDPIECGHEAALGQAQQEVRRLGLMVDEYGRGASALTDKLKRVREVLPFAEQVVATTGPGPASAVRAVIDRLNAALDGAAGEQPDTKTRPEPDDPTQCSGEEGFCPEHGFHRHSLKQPAAPEPAPTEEQVIREHVTTLRLIGEQITGIESWLWQRLADARDTAAGAEQTEADDKQPVRCAHTDIAYGRCILPVPGHLDCFHERQPIRTDDQDEWGDGLCDSEYPDDDNFVGQLCALPEGHYGEHRRDETIGAGYSALLRWKNEARP